MRRSTFFSFILLLIMGAAGYAWYRYFQAPPAEVAGDRARLTRTLADVRRIKNLELDTSIFEDRSFRALEPLRAIAEPEITPGRDNPFAPF